jgi:hypothetical protein
LVGCDLAHEETARQSSDTSTTGFLDPVAASATHRRLTGEAPTRVMKGFMAGSSRVHGWHHEPFEQQLCTTNSSYVRLSHFAMRRRRPERQCGSDNNEGFMVRTMNPLNSSFTRPKIHNRSHLVF